MRQTASGRQRAIKALRHVLPRKVDVRDEREAVAVNGTLLRVSWIGEGWLSDVRELLRYGPERPDVAVAKKMSPGAREALDQASINWVDETGAAEIVVGPIIVAKSGNPKPQKLTSWTPAVIAVAEALLCGTKPTVANTKKATELSAGSCTNALRFLTEEKLLTAEAERGPKSARRIEDFGRLLNSYAAAVAESPEPISVQVGMLWRDVIAGLSEIGSRWSVDKRSWACTGTAAAALYAPYLTAVSSAEVYVDADTPAGLESAALEVGLEPMEGGRLTLRPFPTSAAKTLTTIREGLRLAPWPRVYADLRVSGVRGEEAAEHLREMMSG
jgi:hypothetical protein